MLVKQSFVRPQTISTTLVQMPLVILSQKLRLSRINANHSIFITEHDLKGPIVSIFVDKIKIIGSKRSEIIEKVKRKLVTVFEIVDIGPISFYHGLKVEQNREKKTIKLSQLARIQKVLAKYHLDKANSTNTPIKKVILKLNFLETIQTQKEKY